MVVTTERMNRPRVKGGNVYHSRPTHHCQTMDEYPSWNAAPSMMSNTPHTFQSPYPHFVGIDGSGHLKFHAPYAVERFNGPILSSEFKNWFAQTVGMKIVDQTSPHDYGRQPYDLYSSHINSRKRRRDTLHHHMDLDPCQENEDSYDSSVEQVALEIGDEEKVEAYYEASFRAFQQINCRQVAKAYIKIIEPRKQVKHPYNGGRGAPGEKGDPEKTKPDWWPSGVVHREPDHLKKPERIRLLVHIFRQLGRTHGISADKLEEAGRDAQRQIKPRERLDILDEIYRVRRAEESYERGEIDGSTVIYVVNRDTNVKIERDSESLSDTEQAPTENSEHIEKIDDRSGAKYSRMYSQKPSSDKSHSFQSSELSDFNMESKPPMLDYLSQPDFMTPPSEHVNMKENHWNSFQPMYSPVEYGNGSAPPLIPSHLLPAQSIPATNELPNSGMQQTHLPDPNGPRTQSTFEYIPMAPTYTGSLGHPQLLPPNNQDGSVARYK